jgi:hypothetical protein
MSAPPLCPNGRGIYREASEEELSAAYNAAFPDGMPGPIATFDLNNPAEVERLKNLMSADTMCRIFGPGGGACLPLRKLCARVARRRDRPMPIRPENKARYPKDWPHISKRIRSNARAIAARVLGMVDTPAIPRI